MPYSSVLLHSIPLYFVLDTKYLTPHHTAHTGRGERFRQNFPLLGEPLGFQTLICMAYVNENLQFSVGRAYLWQRPHSPWNGCVMQIRPRWRPITWWGKGCDCGGCEIIVSDFHRRSPRPWSKDVFAFWTQPRGRCCSPRRPPLF